MKSPVEITLVGYRSFRAASNSLTRAAWQLARAGNMAGSLRALEHCRDINDEMRRRVTCAIKETRRLHIEKSAESLADMTLAHIAHRPEVEQERRVTGFVSAARAEPSGESKGGE